MQTLWGKDLHLSIINVYQAPRAVPGTEEALSEYFFHKTMNKTFSAVLHVDIWTRWNLVNS